MTLCYFFDTDGFESELGSFTSAGTNACPDLPLSDDEDMSVKLLETSCAASTV